MFCHIDIPFSIETERRVLSEAGFPQVKVVYEHYNEKHCNALVVGSKAKLGPKNDEIRKTD